MVYFKYIVNHDMNCPPHFWHDSYHSGNYNEWTLSTRHNFRVRNFSKAFYRKAGMEQFVSTALIDWQGWSVCVCVEGGRGEGGGCEVCGHSICRWMGNEDFQYGISKFGEKYGREMVFSTLSRTNEKSGFEIIKNGISIFGHLYYYYYFFYF